MEPVAAHARAIAALSLYFDRLINGPMREAEERIAELPDVEKEDFMRVCEFAYRGDYTVPPMAEYRDLYGEDDLDSGCDFGCDSDSSSSDDDPDSDNVAPSDGNDSQASSYTSTKDPAQEFPGLDEVEIEQTVAELEVLELEERTREAAYEQDSQRRLALEERKRDEKGVPLTKRFFRRPYLLCQQPRAIINRGFCNDYNPKCRLSFAPVLLAHAKLYSIADRYIILALKDLALHKLHKDLMNFHFSPQRAERTRDIVELARFAYSNDNTMDRGDDGHLDDLRELVVEFMVLQIHIMEKSGEFEELLEEGGQFVLDFWRLERKERMMQEEKNQPAKVRKRDLAPLL
ncbi:hypothetical protein BU26DRAFT_144802 [Trematosphaeria pertusa]|uniref:BTB domain-containing protein n=1 Tax=Trematosphaeria pertusa TaxID=390896 RepID=A0A6A6IXV6_9PLEO|nr:uncharacterized protein BU26DRAFT_144802 [Trematosphaeria pertusa]KAF2254762.1 hypothetical protein BU26DRAFT_144802 [Trematosphaeria pertusa]